MLVEIMKVNKEEITACTSLDVAETFCKEHYRVLQDIRELKCSDDFRLHHFVESTYLNKQKHKQPMYIMDKDGFVLLAMGYTGEKAMKFKEAYIKQFNAMEKALKGKLVEREKGIAVRQALTKSLQISKEAERMHGHAYSTYTNFIYKTVFGKNSNQLREQFGICKKDNLRDYFSEIELRQIESIEKIVSGLVDCGMGYEKIKEFISNMNVKLITEQKE